jgi:uncharacterized protein (TIGR02444 family)
MSNPFWEYSLANYSRDGVSASCLALQDEFALDVNVLLYSAWLAFMDKFLDGEHLANLEVIIAPWREQVVLPLRALRRQWRDYPAASSLREAVKRLELDAEHQQQDMMESYQRSSTLLPAADRPLLENLLLVARFVRPHTDSWQPAIRRLASNLEL